MTAFKRIVIFGEGLTEQKFIEKILTPHLTMLSLHVQTPNLGGGQHRSYKRWRKDILEKCKEDPNAYVTTLIDYYGAPSDLPGRNLCKHHEPSRLYKMLTDELKNDIDQPNFIPNIVIHEFEALLFGDYEKFGEVMGETGPKWVTEIKKIINQFETPEHINNSPETAPSKRLKLIGERLGIDYNKRLSCSLMCDKIDLKTIRQNCPYFNHWLTNLEKLGSAISDDV